MKKLILMIVCAFVALGATAQTNVTWNMEFGLGMSGWMGKHADGANVQFSPRIGVGFDIPLTGWVSFQSGLVWSCKGAAYDVLNTDMEGNHEVKVNQNYFHMPLLAAFHIGTSANFDLVLSAGPYLAYGVHGQSEYKIDELTVSWKTFEDIKVDGHEMIPGLNRFDAGLQLGLDLDFGKWIVGMDGEFGFCKIASGRAPHNVGFYFTGGYKF